MPVLQVIFGGLSSIVVIRIIVEYLGLDKLGDWSTALAILSLSRISDQGKSMLITPEIARLGNSIGYYDDHVAMILISDILSILKNGLAIIFFCFFLLLVFNPFLPSINLDLLSHAYVWILVPGSLLNVLSLYLSCALDGCGLYQKRAALAILSHIAIASLSFILTPKLGLIGSAIAYSVTQLIWTTSIVVSLVSELGVHRLLPSPVQTIQKNDHVVVPGRKKATLNKMNLTSLIFDPLIKIVISASFGAVNVGIYEVASKISSFLRMLIVEHQRVNLFVFSSLSVEKINLQRLFRAYFFTFRNNLYLCSACFALSALLTIPLLRIWLGEADVKVVKIAFIINLMWFANSIAIPTFNLVMAQGLYKIAETFQVQSSIWSIAIFYSASSAFGFVPSIGVLAIAMVSASACFCLVFSLEKLRINTRLSLLSLIKPISAANILLLLAYSIVATSSIDFIPQSFLILSSLVIWILLNRNLLINSLKSLTYSGVFARGFL